jgi:ankyrin repeat protein
MTFDEVEKAIKRGSVEVLRTALADDLDPNLANKYGWTILMVAAMKGDSQIGRLLIQAGADINQRNRFLDTALSLAIHTGHPSFVKLLLSKGASLDFDPHGKSADVFLDWVEKCSGNPKERVDRIRELINQERAARG